MSVILVILAVLVALLLAGSAGAMFMSSGMMGGGGGSFNIGWLAVTLLLGVVLVATVFFLMSSRQDAPTISPAPAVGPMAPTYPVSSAVPSVPEQEGQQVSRNQEAAMFKLLDEDEKRLYALIRERGGEMLQKDIVASGSFSKAKVTRLLDKLENKEVVARERHGMTNEIRLRTMPPKPSEPA